MLKVRGTQEETSREEEEELGTIRVSYIRQERKQLTESMGMRHNKDPEQVQSQGH